jgi:acetylornithine aminotransferase
MVPNYGTPSLHVVRGVGHELFDDTGRAYTDLLAGIAVNILGHAHPRIVAAVREQIGTLAHTSNLYSHDQGLRLAERLRASAPGRKALFVNSGTEANETAWKTVRRNAAETGREAGVVVTFANAFHGRTTASLALTPRAAYRKGFEPLPGQIVVAPFNDADALAVVFDTHDVVGVFAECVQGEGGITVMTPDFAAELASLCRRDAAVLVVDEVQTGIARTGSFWAHEQSGLDPDIITAAKGLGGGLPIGAALIRDRLAARMGAGSHGCTFGGNAVACAAANAVLDVVAEDKLAKRAGRLGAAFQSAAADAGLATRGLGLLLGVPVGAGLAPVVVQSMQRDGFLVGQATDAVVRLAPPLTIPHDALMDAVPALAEAVASVASGT